MTPEWSGIERRLKRLKGCLLKLEPLKTKTSDEFASDPCLKNIVERNLEVRNKGTRYSIRTRPP